jgi:hypothetical protein
VDVTQLRMPGASPPVVVTSPGPFCVIFTPFSVKGFAGSAAKYR